MKHGTEMIFYISFGAGMAMGTSSFTMVSGVFELVTSLWAVSAVCLAGLLCIIISHSIAELASMYPSAPGIRTYLKVAFGDRTSLFLVHLYLIFVVLIAGVESYMFALVVKAILPSVSPLEVVIALLITVLIANLLGLELPRWMQILTSCLLIFSLLAFGIYGLLRSPWALGDIAYLDFSDDLKQLRLLPAATAMSVFLFIGFEWVTPIGLYPSSYERKIPLSMPIAILTNVIAYSFFVIGLNSQLTRDAIIAVPTPQVPYFVALLGPYGVYIAGGVSILATFSTFNAGIMGSSRLLYVLTREGNLPKWCAKISLRTGAPIGAISVLGGLVIMSSIIVLSYELELLAAVIGAVIVCFVYAAFMLAVIRLRKSHPHVRRPFRTSVATWIQWLLICFIPLMGIQSLFSLPTMQYELMYGMVFFIVIAFILTHWSLTLAKTQSL